MSEYKRLTHRNGNRIEEYCEVGHCKYADFRVCKFKGIEHNVDEDCIPAMIERLAELEDKIEQGTLIELACKKGDKVYQADCVRVYELTVLGIRVFNNKFYYETQGVGFDNTAIGESIFLTREEAEKRLKELQP